MHRISYKRDTCELWIKVSWNPLCWWQMDSCEYSKLKRAKAHLDFVNCSWESWEKVELFLPSRRGVGAQSSSPEKRLCDSAFRYHFIHYEKDTLGLKSRLKLFVVQTLCCSNILTKPAAALEVKVMGCEKCRTHILACKNARLEKESEVRHSRRLRHQISNLWKQWVQNQELHIEQDSMTQFNFLVIIVSHAEHWLNFNSN